MNIEEHADPESTHGCPYSEVNVWSEDFRKNYWETMADLRAHSPMARHIQGKTPVWLSTTYDDVWNISRDSDTFSSAGSVAIIPGDDPGESSPQRFIPLETDPPEHTGWRTIVNPLFTVAQMKRHKPLIKQIADQLIDTFIDRGRCDVMGEFIRPFQSRFIFSSILALPLNNLGKWEQWAHDALVDPDKADEAFSEMGAAVAQLLEQRAAEPLPDGDIVSALATARPGGREVGMADRVKVLIAIIMGGLESSGTVLSGTIHHFATHPEDRAELQATSALMPNAVEEALRLFVNVTALQRHVTTPVTVSGVELQPGDKVWPCHGSANRDESHFPNADRWSLHRDDYKHVSFGVGIHRCIGAHLARIFVETGIERVLARMPDLELEPDQEIEWHSMPTRGIHEFAVRFTRGA